MVMDQIPNSSLLSAFEERSQKMLLLFEACLALPTEDAIHDVRVAIRRCLASGEVLLGLAPCKGLRKYRLRVKPVLSGLNALRDLQVVAEFLDGEKTRLRELEPFASFIEKAEKRELAQVKKRIAKTESPLIAEKWLAAVRANIAPVLERATAEQLLAPIDAAYQLCLRRLGELNIDEPETTHSLRIAFKGFRYGVEVVSGLIPNFPTELFGPLHEYQSLMGAIQDAEVMRGLYERFVRKHRDEDIGEARGYFASLLKTRTEIFYKRAEDLRGFWRESPTVRQPWEVAAR